MSTVVEKKPGVEVCIWIPRDTEGNYVNALKGGIDEVKGAGRVGHASLKIYPSDQIKSSYLHLMNGKDYVYVSLWPDGFKKAIEEDITAERDERPNSIIRLNKLNIPKMLTEFNKIVNTAKWTLKARASTPLAQKAESCASFVYKLLEIGGIFEDSIYGKSASFAGPSWSFYDLTSCQLGETFGGVFNIFPWRTWIISPKLVLHISASAAESNATDKQDTMYLMLSRLVHREQTVYTVYPSALIRGAAGGLMGGSAAIATGVAFQVMKNLIQK